jgi:phosphoglycerate dehydrogenase-like enzyme
MKRLKVLFLPHPVKELTHPWTDDLIAAVGARHEITVFDEEAPLAPQFEGVEVVVDHGGSSGTREQMDVAAANGARLWQILGTGFEHFDLDYIKARGIPVANAPGQFSSVALAQSAMMFILMLAHRYRETAANFTEGVLYRPAGLELEGRTLGLVGFGASGQDLARRARAFGMRIMAIDVRPIEPQILDELQPEFLGTPEDLDRVVAESDFLSLHLHLNAQTRHTIDRRRLGLMKNTACLINVARGALADEEALEEALLEGRIGGAGLDVFEREPPDPTRPAYQLPNVVVTPHTAGVTDGTSRKRAACTAENVDRIAQDLEPLYRIDL